ncbi:MAG: phage virion morphogenesis protein [Syntrophobacteraceae bacterium]
MAGAMATITVDDRGVLELLERMRERGGALRGLMLREIGEIVQESVQRNFEERRSPDGASWPQVSPRYAEYKRKKRKDPLNILIWSRRLMGSIHPSVQGDAVLVGTDVVYGAIHQFGGKIERKARKQTLYFKRTKFGGVGNLFVEKGQSDFAQDVDVAAHTVDMPERPYLGVREDDWPKIAEVIRAHILER